MPLSVKYSESVVEVVITKGEVTLDVSCGDDGELGRMCSVLRKMNFDTASEWTGL